MNMKLFTIILFAATYVLLIVLPKYRAWVALGSAALYLLTGVMPVDKAFASINWNVLMMLAGTMGTVSFFIESKMPDRMADKLLKKTPNVMWVAVALSLFAGIISAFVDNVATVLMVAPVALAIAQRLKISPVPLLVSIAVSSNLQGAATLVGDTTSIMLGGYAGMDFLDFIFMNGRPGIFWSVELGAIATVPVILFLFRKERAPVLVGEPAKVTDYVPTILLVSNVALLIAASFIPNRPALTNGYICMGIFALGLVWAAISKEDMKTFWNAFVEIDYHTLLLLTGLFVVIGALTETGVIDDISSMFVKLGGDNLFLMYSLIVWGSVLFSAFIDNIPYVATMLPVVQGIAGMMGCKPYVLYFGLLVGATLGGNLTPIGASANIAAIGILQKAGYEVKTKDFMRIGVPFTLIAVLVGYAFCWLVWARA
jgi:Na+/H+ antiporter NhaD/arsenite permease-like protein